MHFSKPTNFTIAVSNIDQSNSKLDASFSWVEWLFSENIFLTLENEQYMFDGHQLSNKSSR